MLLGLIQSSDKYLDIIFDEAGSHSCEYMRCFLSPEAIY